MALRVPSDANVGKFEPVDTREIRFPRVSSQLLSRLRRTSSLTSTASDVLDELGWRLSVPSSEIAPRHKAEATIIGHAVTIRYLPERSHLLHRGHVESVPRLAHHVVFRLAKPGDVMVVDAAGCGEISVMGGLAAEAAKRARLSGVVVDGAVRDLDEIRFCQLPVWSRYVTPITGKARLEAVAINSPILCGGVQVQPGDLVMADASGICFVPNEMIVEVVAMVEQFAREDSVGRRALRSAGNRSTANHPPA